MRFVRHARTVSALTLASRVTGLARDATLSRVFGAGVMMDAFFFAFMIPNLFRRLFGEGALTAAFLPVYTQLDRDDPDVARRLASLIVAGLLVVLGALVVVGELLLLLLSARADHGNPAVWLMMIMLPYMPLVCLVAVLGAMLQVHGRFGPTAAAPLVLNLAMIGTVLGVGWWWGDAAASRVETHVALLAASVVVAGLIQVAWSLAALRGKRWWWRDLDAARAPARRVLLTAVPMIAGLGVLQLNTFFDGLIASYPASVGPTIFGIDYPLEEGAMTILSFAQRLYMFPLGVFGIALATAIFPALSREAESPAAFLSTLRRGLRLMLFIALPASAGLILVRRELVAVIFEGGAFGADGAAGVRFVLVGYAAGVWAFSLNHVLTRAFYARGDARRPLRVAMAVVAISVALNLVLIWTPLGVAGLAWSTTIGGTIQTAALLWLLRRHVGGAVDRSMLVGWARTAVATVVMIAAVGGVHLLLPDPAGWTANLLHLTALVGTGAVAVFASALVLRMPEVKWLVGR